MPNAPATQAVQSKNNVISQLSSVSPRSMSSPSLEHSEASLLISDCGTEQGSTQKEQQRSSVRRWTSLTKLNEGDLSLKTQTIQGHCNVDVSRQSPLQFVTSDKDGASDCASAMSSQSDQDEFKKSCDSPQIELPDSMRRASIFEKWQQMANSANGKRESFAPKVTTTRKWQPSAGTKVTAGLEEPRQRTTLAPASQTISDAILETRHDRSYPAIPASTRSVPGSPSSSRFPSFSGKMQKKMKKTFGAETSVVNNDRTSASAPPLNDDALLDGCKLSAEEKVSKTLSMCSDAEVAIANANDLTVNKSFPRPSSPSTSSCFVNAWDKSSPKAKAVTIAKLPKPTRKRRVSSFPVK
jgi:hypothetical protein